ncbi:sigma-54-dependent transcriptional regulator [Paludibacterium purpuratum]|uniref:Two-component system C4-dicarboxylate transport response regulator DctD/two-component system response regulator AauR n=1 Tax=Paludibacterium purpuratum TaxID=1144873 RepID=A0A4R7AYV1_9NEIS|nr:sigma-54 dependent transcriptional regulator [Paludibacterium purpuratum]TDR73260.1 two-component system C4-dicarboxylate transport response regulator DctD/two-component system response regulator AauR [Paludibacterium purpuratum]
MFEGMSVFIVEDDPSVLLGCMQAFELEGIAVAGAGSAEEALQLVAHGFAGIVISDIRLPGTDGMALLKKLRLRDDELPIILITGHGDIDLAVQAMKDGAYDFLEKPFSPERLVDVARRALEQRRLGLAVRNLEQQLQSKFTLETHLIGRSPAMARIRAMIADLADTAANVLIHGETGSGKELVARCLHMASKRSERPFVALNCGGLSDTLFESELFGHEAHAFTDAKKKRIGKFEYANGGTLLFDEIESMPIAQQIKLLRVLQERSFERLGSNTPVPLDCRIVAATKFDLKAMSDAGQFRSDLYYRLNVVSLELPPLRERREDIPLLFEHFLLQACARFDRATPMLEPDEQALLLGHDWPGNVRELRNVAERFALGIRSPLLPEARGNDTPSLAQSVEDFERVLIAEALRRHDGNLSRACEALKMPKTTLFDKVRKYGL